MRVFMEKVVLLAFPAPGADGDAPMNDANSLALIP